MSVVDGDTEVKHHVDTCPVAETDGYTVGVVQPLAVLATAFHQLLTFFVGLGTHITAFETVNPTEILFCLFTLGDELCGFLHQSLRLSEGTLGEFVVVAFKGMAASIVIKNSFMFYCFVLICCSSSIG